MNERATITDNTEDSMTTTTETTAFDRLIENTIAYLAELSSGGDYSHHFEKMNEAASEVHADAKSGKVGNSMRVLGCRKLWTVAIELDGVVGMGYETDLCRAISCAAIDYAFNRPRG